MTTHALSAVDLDALEVLLAKATPAVWESGPIHGSEHTSWLWERCGVPGDPDCPDTRFGEVNTPDAEAIVVMRNAMPALLAELRELRAAHRVSEGDRHE